MKQIGGCRRIADDPIYLEKLSRHDLLNGLTGRSTGFRSGNVSTLVVAQLKKSLQSSRRMFRPLGLQTVRQQQDQSYLSAPFDLSGTQQTVQYDLRRNLAADIFIKYRDYSFVLHTIRRLMLYLILTQKFKEIYHYLPRYLKSKVNKKNQISVRPSK